MKYRELGRTGLEVSEIGLGCWAIGGDAYGPTSDKASLEALEIAWDRGVNFFDTADTYGKGHSEELIGRFLKGKPRDSIVVATKAGWDFYSAPVRKCFDADYLRLACERSLKRLGADVIDLFQLHNPPLDFIERGDALTLFAKLKREGKIRFAGYSVHRTDEALAALKNPEVETLQIIFNILDQRMAGEVFEKARLSKTALIAREPLASGLLTGKYHAGHEFLKGDHRRRWTAEKLEFDFRKIELVRDSLKSVNVPFSQAALEFVLGHEAVSVVIPGAKNKTQVLENLKASELPELSRDIKDSLREIFQREPVFQQGLNPR